MKKLYIAILSVAFSLVSNTVWASNGADNQSANNTPDNQSASNGVDNSQAASTYYINAPRFVRPLIEKWISEYKKVNSHANFAIAKTAADREASTLKIALSTKDENKGAQQTSFFGQYAILPVTTKNSAAAKLIGANELNGKKLKNLFFQSDDIDEIDGKKNKLVDGLVVYTGSSSLSVSQEFASHYGADVSAFRGKRIAGDDQFLNAAIAKDPKGVTFNAIGNIYDLQTRQLKSNISILPLDVDKNVQAVLTSSGTLDQLLSTLEVTSSKNIPVENVGLTYAKDNATVKGFVDWILSEGKSYNHEYGLMNLSKDYAQR